ncbi:MAG: leucine-rich repeat domain-containing protein [Acidobacteriota bacterium]|nr:leucine-rich repeat domain-containing protein [Acidobacteriota bacterium]
MKNYLTIRLAVGLIAFCFFTFGAAAVNAQQVEDANDFADSPCAGFPKQNVFDSFTEAFAAPERVKCLNPNFTEKELNMKTLPAKFGTLTNLEVFSFGCLEKLTTLPEAIGSLSKMTKLIIDNGNGCSMSVAIPASIGKLQNLRVLRLYGAIESAKPLPAAIGQLRNLEVLDLGRNGLTSVPTSIAALSNLKTLRLEYNALKAAPAFVGSFKNLQELSLDANENIKTLPASLGKLQGLKVSLGNNALKLRDQKALQTKFPNITFSFENEYDDARANEESSK